MSWSSSLSSNPSPNMRLRTRDRSKPLVENFHVGFVDNSFHFTPPSAHEGRSSSDADPMVICPDVTAFAAPLSKYSQLFKYTQHLNSALNEYQDADAVSQVYSNLGDTPRLLCETLLKPPSEAPILGPPSDLTGLELSFDSLDLSDHGRGRTDTNLARQNDQGKTSSYFPEKYLEAIRGWEACLRGLYDRLQASLLSTYSIYEGEVTNYMAQQLFNDHIFRAKAMQQMKQSQIPPSRSTRADDGGLVTFETRFSTYESVKEDLAYIHSLLQLGESGISLGRTTQEITISQRGDAVLQFANNESDSHPVLRFRVLSHMLSETSPLFARIFDSKGGDPGDVRTEGFVPGLPQNPVEYTWSDGAQTRLYRMTQLELNAHGSFELMLHAAHLHNESVPREIEFDTFVALAKVCMRYQCTSPVEMFVEYRWLPQWMHKAIDDMPDGLLLISYAFGLRRLFTRMSKTAILNVVDEDDLQTKPWPQKMKDRLWAVRTAKMSQVMECCSSALQEYLRGPAMSGLAGSGSDDAVYDKKLAISGGGVVTSSKPRCPKGNTCCDATNLGWLMIRFAQLQILPHIMHSPAAAHLPPPPRRSLNQIFDSLRSIVSPPQGHGGVCEYAPTFRAAVNDISNSVQGLTLFEVSGQHGWALSRHKVDLPQLTFTAAKDAPPAGTAPTTIAATMQTPRDAAAAKVALQIMEHVDTPRDLRSVALVSKAFYSAYYSNAEYLSRRVNSGFRIDQQKVLIYDGDDDNSTMVDHDFTPPPSEIHEEKQQGAAKMMREESTQLLRAPTNGYDGERSSSRARGDVADHRLPGPAASSYPMTNPIGSGSRSGDGLTQIDKVWTRRNEEGTEKFLASEVAAHFVVASRGPGVGMAPVPVSVPVPVPVPEDKNLVVMEDKNLREQRDRKVGILL